MRLTVNLEPDLYALAVSLAKAEDCSISAAVNRLLRRSLADEARPGARPRRRNDFLVSKGREPVTADTVARTEAGGRRRMTWLLDGNVLVALVIDSHVHHDRAHRWFATLAQEPVRHLPAHGGNAVAGPHAVGPRTAARPRPGAR